MKDIELDANEEEVFDAENTAEEIDLEPLYMNDFMWAQEGKGVRKEISVGEEVLLDGEPMSPKSLVEPLLEANKLFGPFTLAVDEYKGDNNKTMFAVSQALEYKGKDMHRTITDVRLSAAREIYGFLINRGAGDRLMLLNTAKLPDDKRALNNPKFFSAHGGYEG